MRGDIVTWSVEPHVVRDTPETVGRMVARMMEGRPHTLGILIIGTREDARRFEQEVLRVAGPVEDPGHEPRTVRIGGAKAIGWMVPEVASLEPADEARAARETAGVASEQADAWQEGWLVGRGEAYDVLAAVIEAAGGEVRVPRSAMADPPRLSTPGDDAGDIVSFRSHRP